MVQMHNTHCSSLHARIKGGESHMTGSLISSLCPLCQFVHVGLAMLFPDNHTYKYWQWQNLLRLADVVFRLLPNTMNAKILADANTHRQTCGPNKMCVTEFGHDLRDLCEVII